MADLQLTTNGWSWQLVQDEGGVAVDSGLVSAVVLSIGLEAEAEESQVPEGTTDRRANWMDEFEPPGDQGIGSRLWTLLREKPSDDLADKASSLAEESLQWMIEDGIAESVSVSGEATKRVDGILLVLTVRIQRPSGQSISLRFSQIWSGI